MAMKAGRYIARERVQRKREATASLSSETSRFKAHSPPPQPATPPSGGKASKKKRTNYALQRDYRVLEREKKVSSILENSDFRLQLENILQGQVGGKEKPKHTRPHPNQWLEDRSSKFASKPQLAAGSYRESVIPINDLGGIGGSKYTLAERHTRCKLASVYRLVDLFGWSQTIHNHITANSPGVEGGVFVNAFGLNYQEVTASNLVRVDSHGSIVDPGSTQLGVHEAGHLPLHLVLHKSRNDIRCAIHISSIATVAISAMNCGLLSLSSEANTIGNVSYFDCWEVEREDLEDEIAMSLGTGSKVLVLHNDGAIALGGSIEEAFSVAQSLVRACEIQVAAMSAGLENLKQSGVWSRSQKSSRSRRQGEREWKAGEVEFEALMRMLDNKGYRTGYDYKGLDLLQPGNKEPKQQATSKSAEVSKTEVSVAKSKTAAPDRGKELWESLESDKKQPQNSTSPIASREADSSSEVENQLPDADMNEDDDRLSSLKRVAKKVAESTSESFQKLALRGDDELRDDELNSLDMTQKTAERIAKSTSDSVRTLEDHQKDPSTESGTSHGSDHKNVVEDIKITETPPKMKEASEDTLNKMAEHVAISTGHAMETFIKNHSSTEARNKRVLFSPKASTPESMPKELNHQKAVQPENANQDVTGSNSPALPRIPNGGTAHASIMSPTHDEGTRQLPSLPAATALGQLGILLNPTARVLPPVPAAIHPTTTQPLNNGHHYSPHHAPTEPATHPDITQPLNNGHHHSPQHAPIIKSPTSHNVRKLPAVPTKKQTSAEVQTSRSQNKRNGSDHQPHASEVRRTHRARSLDSTSEYSTTESGEGETTTPIQGRVQWSLGVAKDGDLQTNPLKRVSHTAEMVAESTGRAVHKLTTSLPK